MLNHNRFNIESIPITSLFEREYMFNQLIEMTLIGIGISAVWNAVSVISAIVVMKF